MTESSSADLAEEALAQDVMGLARGALERIEAFRPPGPEHERIDFYQLADVATALGMDPEAVVEAVEARELLAIDIAGQLALPTFQFVHGERTAVSPLVARVLTLLAPVCVDRRTLFAWFPAPKQEVGSLRPADCVADATYEDALLLAARRDAARLA